MVNDYGRILPILAQNKVQYVVVGGVAGVAHGAARATYDLDVVYARGPDNLARVVSALAAYDPYPRGAPEGLPFLWDVQTLQFGLNFTLRTALGFVDLLGEVTGGGTYEDLLPFTLELEIFGAKVRCVTLERLIQLKRAAGRPKDLEAIAELQALLDERRAK